MAEWLTRGEFHEAIGGLRELHNTNIDRVLTAVNKINGSVQRLDAAVSALDKRLSTHEILPSHNVDKRVDDLEAWRISVVSERNSLRTFFSDVRLWVLLGFAAVSVVDILTRRL